MLVPPVPPRLARRRRRTRGPCSFACGTASRGPGTARGPRGPRRSGARRSRPRRRGAPGRRTRRGGIRGRAAPRARRPPTGDADPSANPRAKRVALTTTAVRRPSSTSVDAFTYFSNDTIDSFPGVRSGAPGPARSAAARTRQPAGGGDRGRPRTAASIHASAAAARASAVGRPRARAQERRDCGGAGEAAHFAGRGPMWGQRNTLSAQSPRSDRTDIAERTRRRRAAEPIAATR